MLLKRHVFRSAGLCSSVCALVLLTLAGCSRPGAPTAAKPAASAASAVAAAPGPRVASAEDPVLLLGDEDLRTLQPVMQMGGPVISGALVPERRADLRAELGAVVLQVLKDDGDAVKAGELLLRLDDTALRENLQSADEGVRAATSAVEQADRQVQRLRTLQAQGMVSQMALEDSELRRASAQNELVAARARAVAARQQLRRSEVRAPYDGVVGERRVSAGDTVQVGRELLKVMDPRSMRFEGMVPSDRLAELRLGQVVSFRVNGAAAGEFRGKVIRIDSVAQAATRQVAVRVAFDNPAAAPRVAGLFAEGRVETGGQLGLALPEHALVRSGDAAFVWRLDGNRVRRVPVQLGPRDPRSGLVPVRGGLVAGQQVLLHPGSLLKEGQAVQRAPSAAAGAASAAAPSASAASAVAR